MKKLIISAFALIVIALALFTSCGKDEVRVLNVYNWGEYISDGEDDTFDTNAEFENYFNTYLAPEFGYKVKVNYTTYATNEDMYSRLASGAGDGVYDVIFPSDYMLQKMAEEDMLLSFNVAEEIENYQYIDEQFKGLYYDPTEQYSVPYTYGVVGVIYNPTMMDPEDLDEEGNIKDPSWSFMWNPKYKGKILQFNNPRDAFGTAMYYQNLDINSTDLDVWQSALELLREQKPLLQGYVNDEIFNKMTSESAAIAAYYAGDYVTMASENENLKFYYPKEGSNVFVDAMCIPKTSKNPELAKAYINFMLSEEAAIANAVYIGYASPNLLVRDSAEYIDEMGEDAFNILYGHTIEEINAQYSYDPYYHSFDKDMHRNVNSLWEQLKTQTDVELWVHISSITIVVGVLGACGYTIYVKRRRSKFYRLRDKKK